MVGHLKLGESLTCEPGGWKYGPTSYAYVWLRDGRAIGGATGRTYVTVADDVFHWLGCRVVATNSGGSSLPATSYDVMVEADDVAPIALEAPAVTGDSVKGSTLVALSGEWLAYPQPTYRVQWLRCDQRGKRCVQIPGATTLEYRIRDADVGHRMRVYERAENAAGQGANVSIASKPIVRRVKRRIQNLAPPRLAFKADVRIGGAVVATRGAWPRGSKTTIQWFRCRPACRAIPGATSLRYRLARADAESTLKVVVTAAMDGRTGKSSTSIRVPNLVVRKTVSLSRFGPPSPRGIRTSDPTVFVTFDVVRPMDWDGVRVDLFRPRSSTGPAVARGLPVPASARDSRRPTQVSIAITNYSGELPAGDYALSLYSGTLGAHATASSTARFSVR